MDEMKGEERGKDETGARHDDPRKGSGSVGAAKTDEPPRERDRRGEGQVRPYQGVPRDPIDHGGIAD